MSDAHLSLARFPAMSWFRNGLNQLCVMTGSAEFKQHMRQYVSKPYWERLADFHLLLYLAKQPGLDLVNDVSVLLECVKHKAQVPEGYTLIIDSLAES